MTNETKKMNSANYVIGIDEVGRGALAGPVVVAAAMMKCHVSCARCQDGTLRDSKKLTARQREAWCSHFKNHPGLTFAVARVYPRGIEKRNISAAANLAALRALARLIANRKSLIARTFIFLDGGLFLANGKWQMANCPNAKTIVKADEKIAAVAVSSIIAKVHRDGYMRRLAGKYPAYGFEVHKGYGTKAHYAALKKHGSSPVHRLTFLPLKYRIKP
jgi:ribonuclease HII